MDKAVCRLLVTVDYAERWSTADLLTLLRDIAAPAGVPIRVVMLARSIGAWWTVLMSRLERYLDVEASTMKLPALAEDAEDRLELFNIARDRFAKLLNVADAQNIAPPSGLEVNKSYGLVLTVHMSALAAVLGQLRGDKPPSYPAEISVFLLAREREIWQALYEQRYMIAPPMLLRRPVFTATLTGL